MLSTVQARTHYDRLGSGQDRELRYAAPAFQELIRLGAFDDAEAAVELGCGTGSLARDLLGRYPGLSYAGLDIAPAMTSLTRESLAGTGGLAVQADVTCGLPIASRSSDRVIAAYLFDLLETGDMDHLLTEIGRVLKSGGLLCAVSMSPGDTLIDRTRAAFWNMAHRVAPHRVGGCRPLHLDRRLSAAGWRTVSTATIRAAGIASRIVIARLPASPQNN